MRVLLLNPFASNVVKKPDFLIVQSIAWSATPHGIGGVYVWVNGRTQLCKWLDTEKCYKYKVCYGGTTYPLKLNRNCQ